VLSVTSEVIPNLPYQAAPQRSPRSEQPSGNDIFGSLVDSNSSIDVNASANAPRQPAPQRNSDTPPSTDNAGHTNSSSAGQADNNSARDNDSADPSGANAGQRSNRDRQEKSGSTDTAQSSPAKASDPKADSTKASDKSADGDPTAAIDPAILIQQIGLSATTPVAVALSAPLLFTNAPAATPVSGNANAPLAIAAAAIAASTQTISAAAAPSAEVKTSANAAAADIASPTTTVGPSTGATVTATAKTAASALASQTVVAAASQPTTPAPTAPTNATTLTETVAATTPVVSKAVSPKTSAATVAKNGSEIGPGAEDSTDAPASATSAQNGLVQLPTANAKPEVPTTVEASVANAAIAASTPGTAGSAHQHSSTPDSQHTSTDAPNLNLQAANAIQPQFNSPAAAPVSANTLNVSVATTAPVPLSGLALEIAASAKSGKSRFEIRLDPAELGRIDVRIDIDRNGQMTSHLTVEKPETLSMLRQDAPQLQRALDEAGFKTGDSGLQFSLRDQSSSGQNNGNDTGRNAQRLVISEEETVPSAVAGRSYGRALGSNSGVDIKV
jgi:hypothetical protein